MSVAAVIIAHNKRYALIKERVLPSVQRFLPEVYVVGDFEPGAGYTYLPVQAITNTTIDAIIKRDVGALATQAKWVLYLADDHALAQWSGAHLQHMSFDVLVPQRFCVVADSVVELNMGLGPQDPNRPYCAGHAGLFRRSLIAKRPWCTMPHDRLWDLYASRTQVEMGARFAEAAPGTFTVEDLEPEREPWR